MDASHLLLAFTVLAHSLISTMWGVASTWLGLSRKAGRHWMTANVAFGGAIGLVMTPPPMSAPARVTLAAALMVLGGVSLRRGLQFFLKVPRTDGSHLALGIGLALFNSLVLMPRDAYGAGAALSFFAMYCILLRTSWEAFKPIRHEFNAITASLNAILLNSAALAFALAGLTCMIPQWPWPWLTLTPENAQLALAFSTVALSILSSFVLGYIVVMRLVKRLEHLSHHDTLTGLLNRRAFEYLLAREDQRLQRFNDTFAVLLVDIDHFKRINDRLGHAAGDAVLVSVSNALQARAREVDRVARYGGEEFCILLPHTELEGAQQAAERFRRAIAQLNTIWDSTNITVTISIGLACAQSPGESVKNLLKRADDALYQAKEEGRNQVICAPDPAP